MKKEIFFFLLGSLLFFQFHGMPQTAKSSPTIVENPFYPKLVERFYEAKETRLFWYGEGSVALRIKLVALLDSAGYLGLDRRSYHYDWLKDQLYLAAADSLAMFAADRIFTDAVISLSKDIYQGRNISTWIPYDELSPKCESKDNDYLVMGLSSLSTVNELEWFISFLEPFSKDYTALKKELRLAIDSSKQQRIKELRRSLNLLRWMQHFDLEKYVVVNTGSATVRYYDADTINLRMKAVVGTTATPTPSFAAYCNAVVLYPYWNVPYSIAVKEILPMVKKDASYLDRRGLQVINLNGKVLDHRTINWQLYSAKNFPLRFRQSTGCDNALGVIKFNITDPYSVYLHDTNNKTAFFAGARYLSHGCIRLEKPVELAREFLPGMIDTAFLESCYKDQKPVTITLTRPVPVFVIYATAEYDGGAVKYYKDVYRLVQ